MVNLWSIVGDGVDAEMKHGVAGLHYYSRAGEIAAEGAGATEIMWPGSVLHLATSIAFRGWRCSPPVAEDQPKLALRNR